MVSILARHSKTCTHGNTVGIYHTIRYLAIPKFRLVSMTLQPYHVSDPIPQDIRIGDSASALVIVNLGMLIC